MKRKITLQAWAEARYDPPPPRKTLQRWARDCWIFPAPEKEGYYSWTHPKTGKEFGLGRDRQRAIKEVLGAEVHLSSGRASLVQRITGAANTWSEWCDEFEKILAERESSLPTQRMRKVQMKKLRSAFPEAEAAGSIDTFACANVLKGMKDAGKARTAQAFRSFLIDCFNRMIAHGWRKDNPALVTDEITVKVRRSRLTLDVFMKLYKATELVWLRNAMMLALVAGKDRDSVRNARFADFRDGGWWNERSKTGGRFFLPLNLRLNVVAMSLEDVVRQCRSTGIVSTYLVHQTQRIKGATLGKPMHVDMITRRFSWELDKLGIDWGGKEPPTFHEIRSLAARLHKEQGDVDPQQLLSHKDPKSTAIYTDGRDEWVRVSVKSPAV